MDTLAIIALIVGILGVIGGFMPVLPGPPLSWVALLLVNYSNSANEPFSTAALIIWGVLATIITILDYVLPGKLTALTGGHKAAQRGATIGLIVGIFCTPVGMVLGSFLGAFIGEMIVEKPGVEKSLKAALGAFLAFILTTGMKVLFSVILLWRIIVHLFF